MTEPNAKPDMAAACKIGAEADSVLDHALRERPVDSATEVAFDDATSDATGTGEQLTDDRQLAEEVADDAGDYVLYSDVRPHLEELVALRSEREKLIDLLLYARDRVSSPAVASRMDDGLSLLGIAVLSPQSGDRFEATQHEASATVHTTDQTKVGTIAEVELAGYIDGDRLVRAPLVTVYSREPIQRP